MEKSFYWAIKSRRSLSGKHQQESTKREAPGGKQGERNGWGRKGMDRIGKERTGTKGINALEIYYLTPLNILNKPHPFASLAGIANQLLW